MDENEYIDSIRLGDDIKSLIFDGKIVSFSEKDKIEYRNIDDLDIWIGEEKGKVSFIFYTNRKGEKLIGVDSNDLVYPSTESVCESISKRFNPIPEVNSIEELRKTRKGDFLYVIFRDFIPTNIFIIRID